MEPLLVLLAAAVVTVLVVRKANSDADRDAFERERNRR